MAYPDLSPISSVTAIRLPSTGSAADVAACLPYGVYAGSTEFLSGASDQVAYTYQKLGGNVLDIELQPQNVYAAYEDAVMEYGYLLNIHQAKNSLSDLLGQNTGSFYHDGELSGSSVPNAGIKYPKFTYSYVKRVADSLIGAAGIGGTETIYSASFNASINTQDYDLQAIISASHPAIVNNKRILIKRVYYKTPQSSWRFFGYFGTINVVGNLSTYGQFADDSTFELVPTWQNKLQAMAYSDALYTRYSHYSYRIRNNVLRIYPTPSAYYPIKFWVDFMVPSAPWDEDTDRPIGINGVNNINNAPFANLPYTSINAIGKQWIRRFCLAICKETLGQIRGKFKVLPIPGNTVELNAGELLAQAADEKEKLREELKTILDEMTYAKLMELDAAKAEAAVNVQKQIPMRIFKF